MNEYDINNQFELYKSRVGLHRLSPDSNQHIELKRSFMGAIGQMLVLFRDGIGQMEDENLAVKKLQTMFDQVRDFWTAELNQD